MLRRLARLLRWTAGGFTALVVVVLAALVFADLSRHREAIESAMEAALGRRVSIAGSIGVAPSLPPAIAVENVRIDNVEWARDAHLLAAKELRFALSLPALLGGRVHVTEVEARGFELNLEAREAGPPAWRVGDGSLFAGGGLRALTLDAGVVRYRTPERSLEMELDRLRATLSEGGIALEAQARLADEPMSLSGEGGRLSALYAGEAVPLSWRWRLGEASASGEGSLRLEEDRASFSGRYQLEVPAWSALSELMGLALPELGALSSHGTLRARRDRLSLVAREVSIAGHSAQAALALELGRARPLLRASFKLGELRLASLPLAPPDRGGAWVEALPEALELDLQLGVESFIADGSPLGSATARLSFSPPIARLSVDLGPPAHEASVDISLDRTPGAPRAALVLETGAVDGAAVLEFLGAKPTAFAPRVSSARGELRGAGADLDGLLASVTGSLHLEGLSLARGMPAGLAVNALHLDAQEGRLTHLRASGQLAGRPFSLEASGGGALLCNGAVASWPLYAVGSYANIALEARGTVANPFYAHAADLELTAQSDDLRGAGSPLAVPLRFRARLERDASGLELSAIELGLGASRYQGRVKRVDSPALWEVVLHSESADLDQLSSLLPALAAGGDSVPAWLRESKAYLRLELGALAGLPALSDIRLDAELADGVLQIEPIGFRLGGSPARATASLDARQDTLLLRGHARADALELATLWGAPLGGHASSASLAARASASAPGELLANLEVEVEVSGLELSLDGAGRALALADGQLSIEQSRGGALARLEGRFGDAPLTIEAKTDTSLLAGKPTAIALIASAPRFSGRASGSVERLAWPARFALEVAFEGQEIGAPWPVSGAYSGRARVNAERGTLSVWGLNAALGESDVEGSLRLAFAEPERYEVSLRSRRLVATSDEAEQPAPKDASRRVIPALPLASLFPEGWSGDFDWRVGSLAIAGYEYRDIAVDASAREGRLFASLSGDSPRTGGRFRALLERPAPGAAGTLAVAASSIDAGWLLRKPDPVRWPADIDLRLEGPIDTLPELLGAARGRVLFSAGRAEGEGAELRRWELDLLSVMLPSLGPAPKDEIDCLVASFDIEDGTAKTEQAVLQTDHVTVAANGTVDLASERLRLVLTPESNDTKLLSMATPVELGGTLSAPSVAAAPGAVVLSAGKLLLDTANPLNILGTLMIPRGKGGNACGGAALEARGKAGLAPQTTDSSAPRGSATP